jgi:hypothetical protein
MTYGQYKARRERNQRYAARYAREQQAEAARKARSQAQTQNLISDLREMPVGCAIVSVILGLALTFGVIMGIGFLWVEIIHA